MLRKNGFVAKLICKDILLAVPFVCSRKIANVDQKRICRYALFSFQFAESMSDRTAIWRPLRSGRHLTRQTGSIVYSQEREEKRCSAKMSR